MSLIVIVNKHKFRALGVAEQLFNAHGVSVPKNRCPVLQGEEHQVADLETGKTNCKFIKINMEQIFGQLHPWKI